MGRIKTLLIKRVTNELMAKHGDEFSEEFVKNTVKVNELVDVKSKKLRNIIAGYATRLVKMKKNPSPVRRQSSYEKNPYERSSYERGPRSRNRDDM